jgi:hypothetical protein
VTEEWVGFNAGKEIHWATMVKLNVGSVLELVRAVRRPAQPSTRPMRHWISRWPTGTGTAGSDLVAIKKSNRRTARR